MYDSIRTSKTTVVNKQLRKGHSFFPSTLAQVPGKFDQEPAQPEATVYLNNKEHGVCTVITYTKGDAATDENETQYGRLGGEGPLDLPAGGEPLVVLHQGLFTWGRYHAETNQLPEAEEESQ